MEARRATDNTQQKASDCLGTENEKPYTLGQRIIDANAMFSHIRQTPFSGLLTDDSLNKLSVAFCDPLLLMKIANWKSGRCIIIPKDDNPKKD